MRILDVTIERRSADSAGLLSAERFAHLCLDATFLTAARSVAIAAHSRLPCALEGDTAVAKTTAVLWVAHLCRQEAVRLNLNGQSDTGELVGRFVPNLNHAQGSPAAWRFWEGIVPDAMRHGRWVVLDELNLAEPQVLERLNPVLEQPPSLVLSEHTGERFGLGGDVAVAESFRIFATMNPAEYAGRSVLSPAFRDRWSLWSVLESPGETEYRALLTRLVHGVHPQFVLNGVEWRAADSSPVYPNLAGDGRIDGLLDAIASFHVAVAAAAGGDSGVTLGRARRERYVFTRRTMLAAMSLLASLVDRGIDLEAAALEAIELVYLQRVQPGPDRQAVRSALRTVGLGR
ncbi:MAG: AAA family ATPase [Planctomycetes bacterium]|nr:AAA family ATPase [Planctomycetota bacterium]